jgi:putative transposase
MKSPSPPTGVLVRCDTSTWQPLDTSQFDLALRKRVLARQAAVDDYFHRIPVRRIADQYGIVPSEIVRLANRCMESDADGNLHEWRGVLFRKVLSEYRRRRPINAAHASRGRGLSGAFSDLLRRKPEIEEGLRQELERGPVRGVVHELRVSLKSLHRLFRSLCAKAGVRQDEYPFTTKLHAYRSLGEFARREIRRSFDTSVKERYGQVAASHMHVGTGKRSRVHAKRPLEIMQLDGFDLPAIACVEIQTSQGVRGIAIDRLWLCPLADVASTAVFGYQVSIRPELKEEDVLECASHALTAWEPRAVEAAGLAYPEWAGFPSALSPIFAQCGCAELFIDNTNIHLGRGMQERIADRLGCSINLGPVRHWERRAFIERLGGMLMREGLSRVPSSMGSGPKDPMRKDPVGTAVRKHITVERLLDLIDVEIATLNGLPSEALFNISPLEYLKQYLDDPNIIWPVLPALPDAIPDLDTDVAKIRVSGSIADGRRPHIPIDRVDYTNEIISANPDLIGTWVSVYIRRADMRTVKVFTMEGQSLGTALAMGRWSNTPHSRQTRKLINALKDRRILMLTADQDPVRQLMDYLSDQARKDAHTGRPKISSAATTLARVMRETGEPAGIELARPTHQPLTLREELARKREMRHGTKGD